MTNEKLEGQITNDPSNLHQMLSNMRKSLLTRAASPPKSF